MPKYISLMKLTEQGSKGIKDSPARIESALKFFQKMGGKVIGMYLVMGEYDYVAIGECPSDEVATAFALGISSLGNVKTTTLKAFSKEEIPAILNLLPKA